MNFLLRPIPGLFVVAALFVCSGCSLSDPEETSSQPALTLQNQQSLSLTILTWDKVNVTDFKEYIILQSPSAIPDNPTPQVSQEVTVLKRIDDYDITTLSVSPTLLSPQICYRLYCAVGDRFLYSANLCVNTEIEVVDGFFDRGCHMPGYDEMVLFDRVNNQMASVNYKTGEVTNRVNEHILNFPSMEMTEWNDVINVFGIDQSPGSMRKYSVSSLTSNGWKNFNDILWSANVHQQFVFVGVQEFNNGFQVLSRNTFSVVDGRIGIPSNQYIAVFPGVETTVLTLGSAESKKYTVDETGMVTSEQNISTRVLQPDQQHSCADGTTIFIGGGNGAVINSEGELLTTLNPNINAFIQMTRLTPDETKAVYLININGEIRVEVADLTNLPEAPVVASFVVPQISYADIIPDGNIIYLVGTAFNSSLPQTFILQYPLQP